MQSHGKFVSNVNIEWHSTTFSKLFNVVEKMIKIRFDVGAWQRQFYHSTSSFTNNFSNICEDILLVNYSTYLYTQNMYSVRH